MRVKQQPEDEVEAVREAEFWLALRIQLANGHPNPKRIGCPSAGALERGARARHLSPRLSQHLFACSPCYRVYSKFLREWLAEFWTSQSRVRRANGSGAQAHASSVKANYFVS
jgi:hypothetical protein